MNITVRALTDNVEILNACRRTVWKGDLNKEPSEKFMYDIYMSEHSPIRDKWFVIEIEGIKSWIATHLCRHGIGFTPYIATQREDRITYDGEVKSRDDAPQGTLVNMRITLNAQAFINVSKKRLCYQSHLETIKVWQDVVDKLKEVDEPLAHHCVPNCVYRNGLCSEPQCCKYNFSPKFHKQLKEYISKIENSVSVKGDK